MISKNIQKRVADATVTFLKDGGQGVLTTNNLILTAAHCVQFYLTGRMTLGDYIIEEIQTTHGKLKITPWAVEPVSDIAVVGPLDDQEFCDEVTQFEEFCSKTKPIPLCLEKPKYGDVIPVWIYTHKKTWIRGKAINYSIKKNPSKICIRTDENIEGGTSGSPIVNERGELVSIVSNAGGSIGISREGDGPLLILALPVWIYQEVTTANTLSLYHQITKKKQQEISKRFRNVERR